MVIDIFNTSRKYNVIYADPPWRYSDRKCNGACEFHYDTMTLQQIKDLPVPQLCEKRLCSVLMDYLPDAERGPTGH